MIQPLPTTTLAWLHQSATVKGSTYSQVLLHLLDRVEALEAKYETQRLAPLEWGKDVDKLDRLIALDRDDDEAAPVATDEELADCYEDAAKVAILNRRDYDKALTSVDVLKAQIRAIYNLGRQHGAAQPPAARAALAEPPTDEQLLESAAPPAPEAGEEDMNKAEIGLDALRNTVCNSQDDYNAIFAALKRLAEIATLLQRLSAPAPVVVPVAVSERPWEKGGWTDLAGECWWCPPDGPAYWSMANPAMVYDGWLLPAHAIPIPPPQVGEGE
jgi:hypothetical protein